MTNEELKQEVNARIPCTEYLEPSPRAGHGMYCCPNPECGSGHGQHATGAVKVYEGNTWHCFACGAGSDTIAAYMYKTGKGFTEALDDLAATIGKDKDRSRENERPAEARKTSPEHEERVPQVAFWEYYQKCKEALKNDPAALSYLRGRGISLATAERLGVGYDAEWYAGKPCKVNEGRKTTARIIIPCAPSCYVARSIDPNSENRYMNETAGGGMYPFNAEALKHGVCFIVEGAFDALAVEEAGGHALALNSTSNTKKLLEGLKNWDADKIPHLILCLDNDEAGLFATRDLKAGLAELKVSYTVQNIAGRYKDANEALQKDRDTFIRTVKRLIEDEARPDAVIHYLGAAMAADMARVKAFEGVKTGFESVDNALHGLQPGVYVLGAQPSLGKTTLALQLADNLAAGGQHVLFFSLEQSRLELVSKSLTRITTLARGKSGNAWKNWLSSNEIRRGYSDYPEVKQAEAKYRETIAERLSIIEGNFDCTVSFIRETTERYIKLNKVYPVVIVDYLQIIQQEDKRQGAKEAVEANMTELKRLSRTHNICVIVISALNRANYQTPISFESFRETSGIEYTADVVWGLQLQCVAEDDTYTKDTGIVKKRNASEDALQEYPRKLELKTLKNRYGGRPSFLFDYYTDKDLLVDMGERKRSPRTKKVENRL